MLLFILAYSAGVFTIISPCILPVLPFVFSRVGKGFWRAGLPMLAGMGASFALIASLASLAGEWVVTTNHYARLAAMILLGVFGLALLWPRLATFLAKPAVALGVKLSAPQLSVPHGEKQASISGSALLGVATGLLWAPCAGPVLGLILTGAALQGANAQTSLALLAYAAGAATSLALALLVGGRILALMKRMLKIGEGLRRGGGVAVLVSVTVIALGLDTSILAQLSSASTNAIEQRLIDEMNAGVGTKPAPPVMMMSAAPAMMAANPAMMMAAPNSHENSAAILPIDVNNPSFAPPFTGATAWLNSQPLTFEDLKGKVVLVDFWTYSCINCVRAIPYIRAWAEKYREQGLVVIGVHTPEFAFERDIDNVKRAIANQKITYPVAIDNHYAIWRAYNNQYWPAHYFIDMQGRIRAHHFGEGDYENSERIIQQLLAEAGKADIVTDVVSVAATGAEAASDLRNVRSPETYIGFRRIENFVSPGGIAPDAIKQYASVSDLRLNEWGLAGKWFVGEEYARLEEKQGNIAFRFHARDLHMVLGANSEHQPVRFKVTIDGMPPGDAHGVDVNTQGEGIVTGERLYQLIRQPTDSIGAHEFKIEFLDPGVQAYAFTFG